MNERTRIQGWEAEKRRNIKQGVSMGSGLAGTCHISRDTKALRPFERKRIFWGAIPQLDEEFCPSLSRTSSKNCREGEGREKAQLVCHAEGDQNSSFNPEWAKVPGCSSFERSVDLIENTGITLLRIDSVYLSSTPPTRSFSLPVSVLKCIIRFIRCTVWFQSSFKSRHF